MIVCFRYKDDLDEVLEISANLTDEQKMLAELFDDKLRSVESSTVFMAASRNLTLPEYVAVELSTNTAAYDALIFVWQQKTKHDAVRPVTAARYKYFFYFFIQTHTKTGPFCIQVHLWH